MIRWLKRLTTIAIIVMLLISNVLTLTSSAVNVLLSGAVAATMGIKTLTHLNRETLDRQRNAVRRLGTRMKARATRIVARSAVRSPVTWIPLVGASIAMALTAWELAEICGGLEDLDALYLDMEIDEEEPMGICRASP